jgi:hypothetical protein
MPSLSGVFTACLAGEQCGQAPIVPADFNMLVNGAGGK